MKTENPVTARLSTLLEEERHLLLKGRLNDLPALLERKRALIEELGPPARADLSALHDRLTRNHALLNSAMAGIRRVADRLETLQRTRGALETYDSRGHRKSLGTHPAGKVEKRA
ncbi:hypothetical protein [Thalassovita sp.]|uniref:hypothetical protein n=1 Tax=Thalassovita sp. TaxID=1979401 RepID=UPI0029DE6AA2|nr:hypothetical protein [Thalassovita sp.]